MSDLEKIRIIIRKILEEQVEDSQESKASSTEVPVKTPTTTPTTPSPKRRTIKKPKIHPGSNPKPKAVFSNKSMIEQYTKKNRKINEVMTMRRLINENPMDIDAGHHEMPDPSLRAGIEGGAPTPFSSIELFHKGDLNYNTLEKLGSEEFNDVVREVLRTGKLSMMEIQQTMMMIMRLESPHHRELEGLALNTVKKIFGLPDELVDNIEAKLRGMNDGAIEPPDDESSDSPEEDLINDFTEEEQEIIKKSIDKRIISNALMMGSGYKTHPVLREIKSQIDSIDQRLYPLYTKIMPNMEFYLWKIPSSFATQGRIVLGKSELVFEEKEEEQGEENNIREVKGAKAEAHLFPILLHEIAKAAVEYLFANGLPQYSEAMNREIMNNSESYKDEHWMKLIGPSLWKYLHDAIDYLVKEEGNDYTIVAFILQELSTLQPDEFLSLMDDVIHDGPSAISKLRVIIDEIESDVNDYEEKYGETPLPQDIDSGIDNSEEIGSVMQANIDNLLSNITGSGESLNDMSVIELNNALQQAVDDEDYAKASKIRDIIQSRN